MENLSSLIWNANDDVLRGVFKPSEYTQAILPFVLLRRLDCLDVNEAGLTLTAVSKEVDRYLEGFEQSIRKTIQAFDIKSVVTRLQSVNRLELFLSLFEGFNLHPDVIDNHQMGTVYEELLSRYAETTNADNGDHYTPRDIIELLVALVFSDSLETLGDSVKLFDPCCGTGGMLTAGRDWLLKHADPNMKVELYGQELNNMTWAICQTDILLTGGDSNNIGGPKSSLSDDQHATAKFDYMISNPPFGVNWKSDKAAVLAEAQRPDGRFSAGVPRVSDGAFLFVQHMLHKMNQQRTSRIGVILNGSPLFTGEAGSGESNIRKWILENDLLETIVALPEQMFYNTGIPTYIWILTNRKSSSRRGYVQLIDAREYHSPLRKNLGKKTRFIAKKEQETILALYRECIEGDNSKILPNQHFGYTKITVEQPLEQPGNDLFGSDNKKPDVNKRDTERVPLGKDIDEYFDIEVKPFLPNAWIDRTQDVVGYEINFGKIFYKYTPLRDPADILADIIELDKEISKVTKELFGDAIDY